MLLHRYSVYVRVVHGWVMSRRRSKSISVRWGVDWHCPDSRWGAFSQGRWRTLSIRINTTRLLRTWATSASRYFRRWSVGKHSVLSDVIIRVGVVCLRAWDQWLHSFNPFLERYSIISIYVQATNHSCNFTLTGLVSIQVAVWKYIFKTNSAISGGVYTLESSLVRPVASAL